MAGTDQSKNLGGLLQGITNTITNHGTKMGGMFTDNVRQSFKPNIDMNDPESLKAAAQWATKNGDNAAATKYAAAASALERKQKDRNDTVQLNQMTSNLGQFDIRRQQDLDALRLKQQEQNTRAQNGLLKPGEVKIGQADFDALNNQWNTSRDKLASRIDAFSAGSNVGTGVEGSTANQASQQKDRVAGIIRNRIGGANDADKPKLRMLVSGIYDGSIDTAAALELMNDTGGLDRLNVQRSQFFDNGRYTKQVLKDGSVVISDGAGNRYREGDEGFAAANAALADAELENTILEAEGLAGVDIRKGNVKQAQTELFAAVDNDARLTDALADAKRGLELVESGKVDTGFIAGFKSKYFGGEEVGEFRNMSTDAAMRALAVFTGTKSNFEYTKAEEKAFADLFSGNAMNVGTMKTVIRGLERERRHNIRLANVAKESLYGQALHDTQADSIIKAAGVSPEWFDITVRES
ncbi:hypothetical protein N9S00_07065, partial [Luminiphilus sp.]|nr:hypothetical protein [Luminiphilus sp.]